MIRRFLKLLWIDFQRCQAGWVALPVTLLLCIFGLEEVHREGVVIWSDVTFSVQRSHIFIAPFAAGMTAWIAGRSHRRKLTELEASLGATSALATLTPILSVMIWMTFPFVAFFLYSAISPIQSATWGGPDYLTLITAGLSISVFAGIGAVVGRIGRSPIIAPVTAIAVYIGIVFAADSLRNSSLSILVPVRFLDDISVGFSARPDITIIAWFCLWLLSIIAALVSLALAIRYLSRRRIALIVLSALMATVSANQVLANNHHLYRGDWIEVTPICKQASSIEVCVHPAYQTVLDDVVAKVDLVAPAFAGLSGIPTTIYQDEAVIYAERERFTFSLWDEPTANYSLAEFFVGLTQGTIGDDPTVRATRCVIGAVLVKPLAEPICLTGNVAEVFVGDGAGERLYATPDQQQMEQWANAMWGKYQTFAAMSPEDQRAWLETNWDALRAGDLTLEDLP